MKKESSKFVFLAVPKKGIYEVKKEDFDKFNEAQKKAKISKRQIELAQKVSKQLRISEKTEDKGMER